MTSRTNLQLLSTFATNVTVAVAATAVETGSMVDIAGAADYLCSHLACCGDG